MVSTLDRREALKGADAVICTILAGNVEVWRHDIEIPKKYGVDINVGDTRGPSGIFRALRTIPVMLDICRDMERLCPQAILLNYTNPMAMLCRAIHRMHQAPACATACKVRRMMLAEWIGFEGGAALRSMTSGKPWKTGDVHHVSWFFLLPADIMPAPDNTVWRRPFIFEVWRFPAWTWRETESRKNRETR